MLRQGKCDIQLEQHNNCNSCTITICRPISILDFILCRGSSKYNTYDREEVLNAIKEEFPEAENIEDEIADAAWAINRGRELHVFVDKSDLCLEMINCKKHCVKAHYFSKSNLTGANFKASKWQNQPKQLNSVDSKYEVTVDDLEKKWHIPFYKVAEVVAVALLKLQPNVPFEYKNPKINEFLYTVSNCWERLNGVNYYGRLFKDVIRKRCAEMIVMGIHNVQVIMNNETFEDLLCSARLENVCFSKYVVPVRITCNKFHLPYCRIHRREKCQWKKDPTMRQCYHVPQHHFDYSDSDITWLSSFPEDYQHQRYPKSHHYMMLPNFMEQLEGNAKYTSPLEQKHKIKIIIKSDIKFDELEQILMSFMANLSSKIKMNVIAIDDVMRCIFFKIKINQNSQFFAEFHLAKERQNGTLTLNGSNIRISMQQISVADNVAVYSVCMQNISYYTPPEQAAFTFIGYLKKVIEKGIKAGFARELAAAKKRNAYIRTAKIQKEPIPEIRIINQINKMTLQNKNRESRNFVIHINSNVLKERLYFENLKLLTDIQIEFADDTSTRQHRNTKLWSCEDYMCELYHHIEIKKKSLFVLDEEKQQFDPPMRCTQTTRPDPPIEDEKREERNFSSPLNDQHARSCMIPSTTKQQIIINNHYVINNNHSYNIQQHYHLDSDSKAYTTPHNHYYSDDYQKKNINKIQYHDSSSAINQSFISKNKMHDKPKRSKAKQQRISTVPSHQSSSQSSKTSRLKPRISEYSVHHQPGPINCDLCKCRFKTEPEYHKHLQKHLQDDDVNNQHQQPKIINKTNNEQRKTDWTFYSDRPTEIPYNPTTWYPPSETCSNKDAGKNDKQNDDQKEYFRVASDDKKQSTFDSDGIKWFDASDVNYIKRLGRGTNGDVWKCEISNEGKQEIAAIKVLHNHFYNAKLFNKERKTLAQLNHPNIIKLIGAVSKLPSIIMPLCWGDLRALIFTNSISYNNEVKIGAQILNGVKYLHKKSLIHRDIKPQNILIQNDYQVMISDFGAIRKQSVEMTHCVGTRLWWAPEIFQGDTNYTDAVDIYAVAITFAEMKTLKTPYETYLKGSNEQAIVIRSFLKDLRPEFSRSLCKHHDDYRCWKDLITAMWHRNPDARPTARYCLKTLKKIMKARNIFF